MSLTVKKTGADIEPVSAGVHVGVCYAVFDLGTHYNERWKKAAHKVLVCWEIPDERIELEREGKLMNLPRAISQRYTASLHPKASLRKDLEAWRGKEFTEDELKGFDLRNILGKSCQLQIVHNTVDAKTYANIAAVMGLPRGVAGKQPENPQAFFSFEEGTDLPENMPEWVMDIIKQSSEWEAEEQRAMGNPEQDVGATEPDDQTPLDEESENGLPF